MITIYCHGNLCRAAYIVGTGKAICQCCGATVRAVPS